MSTKDSQFVERALAHPWMFWVYFWKWPRIVRQACAEYDLLAKERDAAKAAHEQAVAANEKVRKWIHVTHQLDATADLRAIWTAGKRLSILLVFFVVTNAFGQAPPYLRNQWTTNANPLALKVISTNGVRVATNVWELDFTNTATVTVSAVSNANKVMVSFTGSGGGGDTIWTNYGADAYTLMVMPGTIQVGTNGYVQATSEPGAYSALSNSSLIVMYATNVVTPTINIAKGSVGGGNFSDSTNCRATALYGGFAMGMFKDASNVYVESSDGSWAGAYFGNATVGYSEAFEASISLGSHPQGSNNYTFAEHGSISAAFGSQAKNMSVDVANGAIGMLSGLLSFGVIAGVDGGSLGMGNFNNSTNGALTISGGSIGVGSLAFSSGSQLISSDGSYAGGFHRASTNAVITAQFGGFASGQATNEGGRITGIRGIAYGIVKANERIHAQGGSETVGALAVGRDITSTNNWTFGIHYTNFIPFSLAVGANGTTQFRAASNSVVIRSSTAPTVGQILTATDTDGTVGWSNAPAGGGGVTNAIGSIYTNNVLAGGPGLTELEFTNTATVTWVATTNAGRVTMSATSAGGGSGIATNDGTGWNTTFLTQTNHNQIVFTNGSKIGATAINTLTLTNANLMFSADNTFDVGASGANRPRDIHVGRNLIVNGISTSLQVPNGHVYIGQDQLYYIASRLSIASSGSSGILRIANEGQTSFDRIQFGGTTAAFPGLGRTNGHLVVVDATRANSTNSLFFGNTVDTTASTGMTMNRQTGRVRLSAGNQTYLVTNNLATANSIVTATINSDDTTALSVKAIPAAGMITLKANAATTADTDISFFISSP